MAINSRKKGSVGEREFAGLIHEQLGIKLIRNLEQSRDGGYDLILCPDQERGPVTESLDRFAIECKRYATATPGQIKTWWQQAVEQAEKSKKIPALAYRANQRDWVINIPAHIVNPMLPESNELEYCAAFSLVGFCLVVRELCISKYHANSMGPSG